MRSRRDASANGPVTSGAPSDASRKPSVPSHDSGSVESGALRDASSEGQVVPSSDARQSEPGESLLRIPGWSVRKRVRSRDGNDVVLEEVLAGFGDSLPGQARLRTGLADGATRRSWTAPAGSVLSDFCLHSSGAISAVLVAPDRSVSLERLSPDLVPLGALTMHDSQIASDPHVTDAGALDLVANGLAPDAARIASIDEAVVAIVTTSWNSVIAYRTSFSSGA